VVFENRRGAAIWAVSIGSAANRVGWPPWVHFQTASDVHQTLFNQLQQPIDSTVGFGADTPRVAQLNRRAASASIKQAR
jgi:hypothetical protein